MGIYIQLAIYGIVALILVTDGIRTLLNKENVFYKKETGGRVPIGLLLITAGGAAISFAFQTLYHAEWAKTALWLFIILAGVNMVWMILQQGKH